MKQEWEQLIREHLTFDEGNHQYLVKEKQTIWILAGDSDTEVGRADGKVFEVNDDALVIRSLEEDGETVSIPWEELSEISFGYAYGSAEARHAPTLEPPPPHAYRL